MHQRRVVITGMGAVTPLGLDVNSLYEQQLEGRSGVDLIRHFEAKTFQTTFAGEIKDFNLSALTGFEDRWQHCGLNTRFALAAAKQALDAAGLSEVKTDRTEIGVYLGSGEGSNEPAEPVGVND